MWTTMMLTKMPMVVIMVLLVVMLSYKIGI